MIDFEGYYIFPAEEVASIQIHTTAGEYPYAVTVFLKSGQKHQVSYQDRGNRDAAVGRLRRKIEMELREGNADIRNSLFLLDDKIKRIDKRQLRIWQQLKKLLGIKDQGDET